MFTDPTGVYNFRSGDQRGDRRISDESITSEHLLPPTLPAKRKENNLFSPLPADIPLDKALDKARPSIYGTIFFFP
ncbi:MAG: hypothetical protein D3906_12425 [Candidatus Electrothrix sp. AUS1_2]|nr:hypothetical protein [Candidatus Electrothrix sp. AUS1_2]